MNREQRQEMLDRLVEMPSIELKMNVPADQRMALSGLHFDPMDAKLREVYFFDTPDLTLFANGVVTRARRTQGDDDDTVVKLRPVVPADIVPNTAAVRALYTEMLDKARQRPETLYGDSPVRGRLVKLGPLADDAALLMLEWSPEAARRTVSGPPHIASPGDATR